MNYECQPRRYRRYGQDAGADNNWNVSVTQNDASLWKRRAAVGESVVIASQVRQGDLNSSIPTSNRSYGVSPPGALKAALELPEIVNFVMGWRGEFGLQESLITHTHGPWRRKPALELMHKGESIRTVFANTDK